MRVGLAQQLAARNDGTISRLWLIRSHLGQNVTAGDRMLRKSGLTAGMHGIGDEVQELLRRHATNDSSTQAHSSAALRDVSMQQPVLDRAVARDGVDVCVADCTPLPATWGK
jgi:hypothetical protein